VHLLHGVAQIGPGAPDLRRERTLSPPSLGLGTAVATPSPMASAQPLSSGVDRVELPTPRRVSAPVRERGGLDSPWLGTAVAVAGLAVAVAGGIGRRGALDLLPGLDGTMVAGVLSMLLLVLHGYRPRFAMLVAAPLVAVSAVGFLRVHERPLAPLGLQIALIGAIAVVADLVRARRAAS
jgi:hypothetical protein